MREILFRGQVLETTEFECGENVVKGDFVEGILVTDGNNAWIVGSVIEACEEYIALEYWYPVDPETVGQFTGLPDKAGNKIFEHDVVRISQKDVFLRGTPYQPRAYEFGDELVVSRLESGFTLSQKSNKSVIPNIVGNVNSYDFWNFHRWLEIIGNIHDSPELLEVPHENN